MAKLLNPSSEPVSLRPRLANTECVENPPERNASTKTVNPVDDRAEILWEQNGSEFEVGEKEQFFSLLMENADIFATSKSDLGRTNRIINTGNAPPICQAVRRLPPPKQKEATSYRMG